jgi:DNA-binding transcriptional LysR family regulator
MTLDPRISLQKLQIFRVVVELESMSRAAERLHLAQPVVSAHMKTLESRVGAKLLERRNNRMVLTEPGAAVYAWVLDVLRRSAELEREICGISDGDHGAAEVAASMTVGSYLLPDVLAGFRLTHHGARITLSVSDPERAMTAAKAGQADFAVIIAEPDRVDHFDLELEAIGTERIVLVAAIDGPPDVDEVTLAELAGLPMIGSPPSLQRHTATDRLLAATALAAPEITMQLGHAEAKKRAIRRGLGAAFLFRSSVETELDAGWLREVVITDAAPTAPILVGWRRDKRFTPMQRTFLEAVRSALREPARQALTSPEPAAR